MVSISNLFSALVDVSCLISVDRLLLVVCVVFVDLTISSQVALLKTLLLSVMCVFRVRLFTVNILEFILSVVGKFVSSFSTVMSVACKSFNKSLTLVRLDIMW